MKCAVTLHLVSISLHYFPTDHNGWTMLCRHPIPISLLPLSWNDDVVVEATRTLWRSVVSTSRVTSLYFCQSNAISLSNSLSTVECVFYFAVEETKFCRSYFWWWESPDFFPRQNIEYKLWSIETTGTTYHNLISWSWRVYARIWWSLLKLRSELITHGLLNSA